MTNDILFMIKQDKMLYDFLKYHSYYYKRIYRDDPYVLKEIIEKMKEENHITMKDKLEDINGKITMVRNILEIFN